MQTFYVTTLEAQTKMSNELLPHVTKCTCGYSLAYIDEKNNCQIVMCDACHENATHKERFF